MHSQGVLATLNIDFSDCSSQAKQTTVHTAYCISLCIPKHEVCRLLQQARVAQDTRLRASRLGLESVLVVAFAFTLERVTLPLPSLLNKLLSIYSSYLTHGLNQNPQTSNHHSNHPISASQRRKMSPSRRSTRKKRQTQLTFTPIPSSSPATSQYPEQIQRRAASVRYDETMSTPTKKRRIGGSTPVGSPFSRALSNGGSPFPSQKIQVVIGSRRQSSDQLPTPAASSQVEVDSESGIYISTKRERILTLMCFPSYRNREKTCAV